MTTAARQPRQNRQSNKGLLIKWLHPQRHPPWSKRQGKARRMKADRGRTNWIQPRVQISKCKLPHTRRTQPRMPEARQAKGTCRAHRTARSEHSESKRPSLPEATPRARQHTAGDGTEPRETEQGPLRAHVTQDGDGPIAKSIPKRIHTNMKSCSQNLQTCKKHIDQMTNTPRKGRKEKECSSFANGLSVPRASHAGK